MAEMKSIYDDIEMDDPLPGSSIASIDASEVSKCLSITVMTDEEAKANPIILNPLHVCF